MTARILVSRSDVNALIAKGFTATGTPDDSANTRPTIARFLKRHTVPDEGKVAFRPLYNAYVGWCRKSTISPCTAHLFGRALSELGYPTSKDGSVAYKKNLGMLTPIEIAARLTDEAASPTG